MPHGAMTFMSCSEWWDAMPGVVYRQHSLDLVHVLAHHLTNIVNCILYCPHHFVCAKIPHRVDTGSKQAQESHVCLLPLFPGIPCPGEGAEPRGQFRRCGKFIVKVMVVVMPVGAKAVKCSLWCESLVGGIFLMGLWFYVRLVGSMMWTE